MNRSKALQWCVDELKVWVTGIDLNYEDIDCPDEWRWNMRDSDGSMVLSSNCRPFITYDDWINAKRKPSYPTIEASAKRIKELETTQFQLLDLLDSCVGIIKGSLGDSDLEQDALAYLQESINKARKESK